MLVGNICCYKTYNCWYHRMLLNCTDSNKISTFLKVNLHPDSVCHIAITGTRYAVSLLRLARLRSPRVRVRGKNSPTTTKTTVGVQGDPGFISALWNFLFLIQPIVWQNVAGAEPPCIIHIAFCSRGLRRVASDATQHTQEGTLFHNGTSEPKEYHTGRKSVMNNNNCERTHSPNIWGIYFS